MHSRFFRQKLYWERQLAAEKAGKSFVLTILESFFVHLPFLPNVSLDYFKAIMYNDCLGINFRLWGKKLGY